mmetsp:Transcript_70410/g.195965  ORF Transcript_70410/g.195965 Transcript_70410/m.195965 type:complete len:244 (-) Transcript_70410:371-1102(-)
MSWLPFKTSRLPIMTLYGLFKISLASFRTSFGQVAVKKSVWRFLGTLPKILRIWGSKPMSNIRSASSSTKYVTEPRDTTPESTKSTSRPGVATTICAPYRSLLCWPHLSQPPYTLTVWMRPLSLPPDISNTLPASSVICTASSRVGTSTRITGDAVASFPADSARPWRALRSRCTAAGSRNASVLPLPVCARPITSRPASTSGRACACIGMGAEMPFRRRLASTYPGRGAKSSKRRTGAGQSQ